jgi:hypothetical protein
VKALHIFLNGRHLGSKLIDLKTSLEDKIHSSPPPSSVAKKQ